jgi:hypothetical protein
VAKKKTQNQDDWNWMWPSRTYQAWIPGLVVIFIGVVFLLRNMFDFRLDNWWAAFILIPALGNLLGAYERYRSTGRLDGSARSHLFWGVFFVILAGAFFLGLDWGMLWPAFMIIAGLGILLGAFGRRE